MSKYFISFLLLFYSICIYSQENDSISFKRHTIFGEILGNSIIYSVNYDLVLYNKIEFLRPTITIGYGNPSFLLKDGKGQINIFSAQFNLLVGKQHFLEVGIGLPLYFYEFIRIGYRYQQDTGGFFFRLGYLYNIDKREPMLTSWCGMGLGYSF